MPAQGDPQAVLERAFSPPQSLLRAFWVRSTRQGKVALAEEMSALRELVDGDQGNGE